MTAQKAKNAIVEYSESKAWLNFLMKAAPVLIFLKPVAGIFANIFLMIRPLRWLGIVLKNLDAFATLLFIVGIFFCFINEVGFPLIGALALQIIYQLIMVFLAGVRAFSLNNIVYLLTYVGLLVAAVVISARKGDFQRAQAEFKGFMAPRQQQQVICPVCGQPNASGANFCTNCGSQLPAPTPPETQEYPQGYVHSPYSEQPQGQPQGQSQGQPQGQSQGQQAAQPQSQQPTSPPVGQTVYPSPASVTPSTPQEPGQTPAPPAQPATQAQAPTPPPMYQQQETTEKESLPAEPEPMAATPSEEPTKNPSSEE